MLPLGETDPLAIASYRLLGVLGGGGMGKVYLGESRSGRRVAIKVVRSELAGDPAFRRRFAREVAAVRAVSPLFTAAVVDADADAAEPWLATTYIDGPSLATLVATAGPFAPAAVMILAAGLSDGLASIHRAGLVHRDLKPSNVIITDHGPHIIDFGIALSAESGATTSMLLGTPSYIAPERIHGSEADPASDIFSLGATLVYAATGRPLVDEGPVYAQLMQIATGRFSFDPVPPDLRPLITRCVSLRAKDRPTADELTRLLSAAGIPSPTSGWFAAGVAGPTVSVSLPSNRLMTRRRVLIAGGVIGAAAAASAVAAVILEPAPPVAYAMRVLGRAASAASAPPPAPTPGAVMWQLRSGAAAIAPSPGQVPAGQRILVDASRVVTVLGSDVVATRPDGRAEWRTPLAAGLVTLRRWGDAVLVNDARRLWLLDWATGTPRFVAPVVEDEERILGAAGTGAAAQIGDFALAANRAFVSLGTATIAVDRSATRLWRVPRPPRQGPDAPPPTGGPVTADEAWLLSQVPNETGVQVTLRSAKSGSLAWTVGLPPADPVTDGSGGGGPPGGGPPPPDDNDPPGGQGNEPRRESDVDWYRVEGRLTPEYAVLREARNIRVFNLSGGGIRWQHLAPAPVVSMAVVGDLVLIGGDRLTAVSLASGGQRWQAALRGARVAGTPDGRLILAASDEGCAALSVDGVIQWRTAIPSAFADSIPDHVSADEHTAFITFKPRDSRREQFDDDVLAIALDEQAVRPGR